MLYFAVIAFTAGAAIALQMSLNAQLGQLLHSPLYATAVAFAVGLVCIVAVAVSYQLSPVVSNKPPPSLTSIPWYLWCGGGFLSAFAITAFYSLIPKMGIGPMVSFALSGQIIIAMLAGQFGWFNAPLQPLSTSKILGVALLIGAVYLINRPSTA